MGKMANGFRRVRLAAVAAMAIFGASATWADDTFPRYERLEPAVGFWTSVFGEYSVLQSAIHSSVFPGKVFEVLDFRDEALRMSDGELARTRSSAESAAKSRYETLLRQVDALRGTPQKLNPEQKRIFDLFADVKGDDRFKRAIGTLRAQRGLRERTEQALNVAGRYLPEMERTFASYELPLRLTRLPLVESSFNLEAYSKVGASGIWQFMPSSARIYMRLDETVDDRSDPWTSTDGAARHLRDDYALLKSWPLALTAYNHGRAGIARGLKEVGGTTLMDLIDRYDSPRFGFASRNFYAEFLAASQIELHRDQYFPNLSVEKPLDFERVELPDYVPWTTVQRLSGADAESFRRLNPGYRPEIVNGQLYVPAGHTIRVPAGTAAGFLSAYAALGTGERFDKQRDYFINYKVRRGDALGSIAQRHGTSVAKIQQLNHLKGTVIRVGQLLRVPQESGAQQSTLTRVASGAAADARARTHTVRKGQTLGGIAEQYRVSVADLQRANGIRRVDQIRIGQTLKIPAAG